MTSALQSLVDRGLFLSVEHQRAFEEHLVPDAAQVDFAGPRVTLPGTDGTAIPYLLGSSSPSRGTWIWSWQQPEHFLPAVLAAAEATRRYGVDHDVPELAEDEVPLAAGLDERLVIAAKTVSGVHAHYTAGAGGGARVWMLVRSDALVLDPPTVRSVGRTIAEGLHTGLATDHRAAVEGYARRRGLHLSEDADDRVVLSTADGGVELTFDGSAISGIDVVESRLPAGFAPEPVPVTLVEPEPVERPAAVAREEAPAAPQTPIPAPVSEAAPEPAREQPEPAREQPSYQEPTREAPASAAPAEQPVPTAPAADEAGTPEQPREAPRPEETQPEETRPAEPVEPQEAPDGQRTETPEDEEEPRRKGFFGRLFGR
ncbi:DUF6882 domain-containing protein [Tersicoccus sp. Bi-70]|uniref:DUF6882 domain-containing protein n=1 Tax=Tersicoccus sp. Bi-70 TaxID=1897634 RepID=UPI0009770657|nr:DUF6882 domain-containing protein [Tersicoccus sp. Bi-70]OMH34884.1 hypothetical protein BGP79_00515 [Tersicoccus sp. Bi-70]